MREPLKKSHLQAHVSGGTGVGLAPITPGTNTTQIAVLDFDSHKGEVSWDEMVNAAGSVGMLLRHHGLAPIPFRSSGGRGIHLIMLFETAQDAYSVRELLEECLNEAGFSSGTKGVKQREVEIFPKQDEVPADGFGSMFVLPLTGESLPLDPHTLALLNYDYAEDMKAWPVSQPVPVLAKPVPTTRAPGELPADLQQLRAALQQIPQETNPLEYDSWRNVIFGIHHASGGSPEGLALAHEFSSRSSKYLPEFLDERVWPHIRSDRSGVLVTEASIYALAREYENPLDDFEVLAPEPAAGGPAGDGRDSAEPGATIAAQPPAATHEPFTPVPVEEFVERPAPRWIVRNLIPAAELAVIYGASKAGKSFLALDISACVQQGVPWRDLRVEQGNVCYIAAEGAGGFRNRLVAYRRHHEVSLEDLRIIPAAPNLLKVDQVKRLAAAVNSAGKFTLIVVDTLAQVIPGADENSAEHMGTLIAACKALHRLTGATILLVHHAGKDPTRGMRGSSAVQGACDAVIEVTREGAQRLATVDKMKDGMDGAQYPFKLSVIPIGEDEHGDVIDSCVIEHLQGVRAVRKSPKGINERAVLEAMQDLMGLTDEGFLNYGEVVDAAAAKRPDDARAGYQIRRAVDNLLDKKYLEVVDGKLKLSGG